MGIGKTLGSKSVPHGHAEDSRLVMTDYGFLFSLGLALLVAIDPLEANLERIIYTKHLPMAILLVSLTLAVIGAKLFRWNEKPVPALPAHLPLLGFAAFIIAGGLYARLSLDIQNSFLVAGLYMLAAPMVAAIFLRSSPVIKLRLLQVYFVMLGGGALVVFVGLAINYGVRQVYHELEYLFPPLAVLCAFSIKRPWLRWTGVGFFLLTAALFKKNTGYIVGLLTLSYLVVFYVWPKWKEQDGVKKLTKLIWLFAAGIALIGLAVFLIANRDRYLPSGNPAYRMVTYEMAWQRFQASPLVGSGFTSPASEKFKAFDTGVSNNVLPSHSDILDIFANGGALGVVLWLWALGRVAWLSYGTVLRGGLQRHPLVPYAHVLACMSIAGVLTYAFNPIFLQPAKALLLWAHIGLLVAIALTLQQEKNMCKKGIRRAKI